MWKSVVGHDVSVSVETQSDDWDTDPDFVNDISEKEQRWGAKTVAGSGRTEHINIHQLRSKVSEEHDVLKKKELESGPKASHGYGGRFGVEKDRMDKSAVGHEYVAEVGKHSSQTDAAKGFGGKYGVEKDRADKSAVGFDYKGEVEKHTSQKDYSHGFGGRFGVEKDRRDKAALGYDYKGETEKHESQRDYAKGFGGQYGIQKDRVDKSAVGFNDMEAPTTAYKKTTPVEATWPPVDSHPPPEPDPARSNREHPVPALTIRQNVPEDGEEPPALPPRTPEGFQLAEEPVYEAEPEPENDYEDVEEPARREQDGEEEGGDYEDVLEPEAPLPSSQTGSSGSVLGAGKTSAIALYDYQGEGSDELSFDPDDIITDIEMVDAGWWQGHCHGRFGLFPANYVKLL
uniref:Hematopoietic lineage cell-specific protein n=1 Tax=Jaculus jaculus TaxID=51337 RepID=A0A8C5KRY7_JACJA